MSELPLNSDTVVNVNPFVSFNRWNPDKLRSYVKRVIADDGLTFEQVLPRMAHLGSIEDAAQAHHTAIKYIDDVATICKSIIRANMPEPTPYVPQKPGDRRLGDAPPATTAALPLHETTIVAVEVDNKGWSWRCADHSEFTHTGRIADPETAMLMEAAPGVRDVHVNHSVAVRLKVSYNWQRRPAYSATRPFVHKIETIQEETLTDKPAEKTDDELLKSLAESGAKMVDELTGEVLGGKPADIKPMDVTEWETMLGEEEIPMGVALDALEVKVITDYKGAPSEALAIIRKFELAKKIAAKPHPRKPEDMPPAPTLQQKIAWRLNDAFPSATREYKEMLVQKAINHKSTELAMADGMSELIILANIDDAIEEAKKLAENLPDEKSTTLNGTVETAQETKAQTVPPPAAPPAKPEAGKDNMALTTAAPKAVSVPSRMSSVIPTADEWTFIREYSTMVAATGIYSGIDTPAKAAVIIMRGRSLNVSPDDALSGFYLIVDEKRNKTSLFPSVKLMKGLVERTQECLRFDVVGDSKKATATIQRTGRDPQVFTFTIEEAGKMGLLTRYGWERMPERMLMLRVCSKAISMEFPDVYFSFGNMVEEEAA